MGAIYKGGRRAASATTAAISYNGNKIITGSSGGCLLTNDLEVANKARRWSKQARENTPWYQHEEVGYNYRMSNVIAGVVGVSIRIWKNTSPRRKPSGSATGTVCGVSLLR